MNKNYLLLALISLSVHAEIKELHISTSIDVSNLYTNSIDSLTFSPSNLELEVGEDKTRFETSSSTLTVQTSIPKEVGDIAYIARLVRNDASCTDYSGLTTTQTDLVSVIVDSQPIDVGGTWLCCVIQTRNQTS